MGSLTVPCQVGLLLKAHGTLLAGKQTGVVVNTNYVL